MSIRHLERVNVERRIDDAPSHDFMPFFNRKRKTIIGLGVAGTTLAVGGFTFLMMHNRGGEVKAQQKNVGLKEKPADGISTPPSPIETSSVVSQLPSSVIGSEAFQALDPATQADIVRLNRETLAAFEAEPAAERAEFSQVFDGTYHDPTKAALAPYDAGGDKTRLIPIPDPDPSKTGQTKLTTFSFRYDESLVSLEVDGNPDSLTKDPARLLQAQKNLAGLVFSTESVTYSSPYTAMQDELESATSFDPSKATETNFTAPAVAFRESAEQPANTSPNGDPFMVVDDEPSGVPSTLQYNFVEDAGKNGKPNALLVSIMPASDQFAIPDSKLTDNY